jgi:hypothetical protein
MFRSQSYPSIKTNASTWDAIEDLGVKFDPSKGFFFRIMVFDCDERGRKHLLIGMSEMDSVNLSRMSARLMPIQRDGETKGFLHLVDFQLDSPCTA